MGKSLRSWCARRIGVAGLACLALSAFAGQLPGAPAGQVRFYNIADADFDIYSDYPTSAEQQWMRGHYERMQTYSPYFDARLSWYPNAWAYKNSFGVQPGSWVAVQHPEWILRDTSGNLLYLNWGCSAGTCPQYAGDFGNPSFRSRWIGEARQLIARGYKGLWVDDVNLDFRTSNGSGTLVLPVDPRTGRTMTPADWRRYMAEFMEQLRAAVPAAEIAHNAIWYAGPVSDAYVRRQINASDYFNLERGVYDRGLVYGNGQWGFETFLAYVDSVHSLGRSVIMMDYGTTTTDREFGLAGMLLVNEGRDLLSSNQLAWTAPGRWWAGYDTDLGESSGSRFKWQGLLRRDFECGMVLLNQPGAPATTVTLPGTYTTIEGARVSSVTLQARQSRVLKSQCDAGGGAQPDTDRDGVPDAADNCVDVANGPLIPDEGGHSQLDADGDGYGNICDADLDNSGQTTSADYNFMRNRLARASTFDARAASADMNGSGWVTSTDYTLLRKRLGTAPGPSGVAP
jgi:hypothetical protein